MRRALPAVPALMLAFGCQLPGTQTASTPPAQPQPPPYYYPQQQPYPYYPPPQQQPYPQPYPPPAPTQPAPAPTQPAPGPAPSQQPQPYNPWLTMLSDLLKGGAPPLPWPLPGPQPPQPQPQPTPVTPGSIDARGLELANAINQYRAQNGLPAIPISKSLSRVADTHVHDLASAPKMPAECNDHSWTARGPWTPCCYTADHAQAKCMWNKPGEITPFKGTGFEISIGQPGEAKPGLVLDAKQAIAFWQSSGVHNDVILNRGQWQSLTWRAMGAGIIDTHASAWFSDTADATP